MGRACLGQRDRRRPAQRRGFVDPAWLFLLAGLAATGALVLIPAAESLEPAHYQRDAALTWEHERLDRLARHRAYLDAVRERDPAVIRQLRILHLNRFPAGLEPIGGVEGAATAAPISASVFEKLEPEALPRPEPPATAEDRSRLAAWAVGERSRLWLAGAAGLCLLIGLLPAGRVREQSVSGSAGGSVGDPRPAGSTVTA
ncbi:MAG: hypothetical protein AAGF47_00850 [Planctomycetota bacterium]